DGHRSAVTSVAYSPDGKRLASADRTGNVVLWDASTGKALRTVEADKETVHVVACSPDGKHLASAGRHGGPRPWALATGKETRGPTRDRYLSAVRTLAFSPDGAYLAFPDTSGKIHVWPVRSDHPAFALEHARDALGRQGLGLRVLDLAFGPDDRLLASGSTD